MHAIIGPLHGRPSAIPAANLGVPKALTDSAHGSRAGLWPKERTRAMLSGEKRPVSTFEDRE